MAESSYYSRLFLDRMKAYLQKLDARIKERRSGETTTAASDPGPDEPRTVVLNDGFEEEDPAPVQSSPFTTSESMRLESVRLSKQLFINLCNDIGDSRELDIAIARMEEAAMWVCNHISRHPETKDTE